MADMTELRTRREGVQRIQVGLAGLAGVLLLVTLANLITAKVRPDLAADAANAAAVQAVADNAAAKPNEPLADLGVTPSGAADTAPVAPSVPDLQPDPRLQKPMDRETRPAQ